MLLSKADIQAIASEVARQINQPLDKWLPPNQAAEALGIVDQKDGTPQGETIRRWCRRQEVFRPGTEARKTGKYWAVNVTAYSRRIAKEQSITRKV